MLSHINVGSGKEITIKNLAEIIKKVVNFKGNLNFDTNMPDGSIRKLVDSSRLTKLGWKYTTDLEIGLTKTYDWYLASLKN